MWFGGSGVSSALHVVRTQAEVEAARGRKAAAASASLAAAAGRHEEDAGFAAASEALKCG